MLGFWTEMSGCAVVVVVVVEGVVLRAAAAATDGMARLLMGSCSSRSKLDLVGVVEAEKRAESRKFLRM